MDAESINFGKILLESLVLAGGLSVVGFNALSFTSTLFAAEEWTAERFQEQCKSYWRQTYARKDLKGLEAEAARVAESIFSRPGRYLACKYLSKRSK